VLKLHRDWLLELRRRENDLTLDAIAERLLRTHGGEADKSMLCAFSPPKGSASKKTVRASEQDRPNVAERRCAERPLEDDDVSCACEGLIAPFVLDGPINAECFLAYVEQLLVPVLRQGDMVILDNLSSHKNEEAARLIASAAARLLFLPPYSPNLNPIEMAFAKLKELLRQPKQEPSTPSGISSHAP
jgi:transposase